MKNEDDLISYDGKFVKKVYLRLHEVIEKIIEEDVNTIKDKEKRLDLMSLISHATTKIYVDFFCLLIDINELSDDFDKSFKDVLSFAEKQIIQKANEKRMSKK